MNIRSSKGFILPIALFFIILAIITSIGMYTYGYFITHEVAIQEPDSIRGYYAAVAAARYTYLLLKDPAAPPIQFATAAIDNEPMKEITLTETLRTDLNLKGNDSLSVQITERSATDDYQVTAIFRS